MRHGGTEIGDLAEEGQAVFVAELIGVRGWHRFGAAVPACQRTSLGHLPINVHWRLGVVARLMSHIFRLRPNEGDV